MNKKFKDYRYKLVDRLVRIEKNIKRLEKRQYVYFTKTYKEYEVNKNNYDVIRKWIYRYNNSLTRLKQLWPYIGTME